MQEYKAREQELTKLGVGSFLDPIGQYIEKLRAANLDLNLYSRKMPLQDLIDNHILDALLGYAFFAQQAAQHIADFGSGGGLPVVLLAITFPERRFVAFEKSPLKREFLQQCGRDLCANLEVRGEIADAELESVDLITARAFKPIDTILKLSRGYYQRGGRYLLYKARREVIENEVKEAKLPPSSFRLHILQNPVLDTERHLVEISKRGF